MKQGKTGTKSGGGVPTPKVSMPSSSQGSTFRPEGEPSKGTSDAAYDGTHGS